MNLDEILTSLLNLQEHVHRIADEKGWHDRDRELPEIIALIHSELSEALEDWRCGKEESDKIPPRTPVEEEFADVIIRILDAAGELDLNVAHAVIEKTDYNEGRDYRHGGKKI